MGLHDNLSSTQRGKIAELHVATALMSQSGGQLSPFEPMSDDHGIDLLVFDKLTGQSLPIQVKSWMLIPEKQTKTVQFDVQKSTFATENPGILVCVLMDAQTLSIAMAWMFPTTELPYIATDRPGKYVLAPSLLENSRDKYVRYRHDNIRSLTDAVCEVLVAT